MVNILKLEVYEGWNYWSVMTMLFKQDKEDCKINENNSLGIHV